MSKTNILHEYQYSLDVLTDGSEHSGEGTLFLSVHRARPSTNNEAFMPSFGDSLDDTDCIQQGDLVARYCISGVGDCISRLAADQRYKLGFVKAVFSCHHNGVFGLPSLLYALRESGSETLTVVTANSIDSLAELMTRNLSHPRIQLCQVPTLCQSCREDNASSQSSNQENVGTMPWWMVYQDTHIKVHAQRVSRFESSEIIFFYTLTPPTGGKARFSFLIAPPGATTTKNFDWPHDEITDQPLRCDFIFCVGWQPVESSDIPQKCFWTSPRDNDPLLLSRSYSQSVALHNELPTYFPFRHVLKDEPNLQVDPDRLLSSSSLTWKQTCCQDDQEPFWTAPIVNGGSLSPTKDGKRNESTSVVVMENLVSSLFSSFAASPKQEEVPLDENEITLEDDDEDDEASVDTTETCKTKSAVGQLLVLGTGCASPSPYRGASGHVLFGHDNQKEWAIVLEAGEGFVTQWYRYSTKPLSLISVVWVSHAHWDHYGGLAPLLLAIAQSKNDQAPQGKRLKIMHRPQLPVVFAPRKVLNFLHAIWPQTHDQYFRGIHHEDGSPRRNQAWDEWNSQFRTSPMCFWDNVLVDHSCRSAFGCIIGLRQQGNPDPYVCVFSGDTRPCKRLVQACRRRVDCVDFLIHEATFEDAEIKMSIQKKHSTVSEALDIASQIQAKKTLLSHFSQRYTGVSTQKVFLSSGDSSTRRVALALDGLLIPLHK